jgi:hypothetical protein
MQCQEKYPDHAFRHSKKRCAAICSPAALRRTDEQDEVRNAVFTRPPYCRYEFIEYLNDTYKLVVTDPKPGCWTDAASGWFTDAMLFGPSIVVGSTTGGTPLNGIVMQVRHVESLEKAYLSPNNL